MRNDYNSYDHFFEHKTTKTKIEKDIITTFKKQWVTEVKNPSDYTVYKGNALEPSLKTPAFASLFVYLVQLFDDMEKNRLPLYLQGDDNSTLLEQIRHYEQRGGLCIYFVVLAYVIMLEQKMATDKQLKLVQGYYYHKTRTDDPFAMLLGNEHVGIHAWLSFRGAVLDMTIAQERDFFDFGNMPYILGAVPEGMLLKGFAEPKKTVNKYVEEFARHASLSPSDWIAYQVERWQVFKNEQL